MENNKILKRSFKGRERSERILALYLELLAKHGKPEGQWNLWCKRPKIEGEKEEVIIGAILTQRTNWKNVGLAMKSLKNAGLCGLNQIHKNGAHAIAELIRPSGFYSQKSGYLFNLARFIVENYKIAENMQKEPLEKLRKELLELKGIGPETADSILLYALEKPIFVIDEYTRRLAKAKGISDDGNYMRLQKIFEAGIEKNYALYQDFHALIVIEGKTPKNN